MIIWDRINIANSSLASGVTLTPHGSNHPYLEIDSGIVIHGGARTIINQNSATFTVACDLYRPNGASYNPILNLQYQATSWSSTWSANYCAGENFLETDEIRPTDIKTQTVTANSITYRTQNNCQASISGQQITMVDNSGFDEQTIIKPAKIISQNWIGSTTILGGEIQSQKINCTQATIDSLEADQINVTGIIQGGYKKTNGKALLYCEVNEVNQKDGVAFCLIESENAKFSASIEVTNRDNMSKTVTGDNLLPNTMYAVFPNMGKTGVAKINITLTVRSALTYQITQSITRTATRRDATGYSGFITTTDYNILLSDMLHVNPMIYTFYPRVATQPYLAKFAQGEDSIQNFNERPSVPDATKEAVNMLINRLEVESVRLYTNQDVYRRGSSSPLNIPMNYVEDDAQTVFCEDIYWLK